MARAPRVVAELGRPETPDETADRKAEASRVYRSSQTTRNLIAALLVTLAVVAVIVFAVPRGAPPAQEPIDVAAVAAQVSAAEGRSVIAPSAPVDWRVNAARVTTDDAVRAWTVVYAPATGFLRVAQGFDADASWPSRVLAGAPVADTVIIGGVEWDRYEIRDPARAGNISVALSTLAGPDTVLVYGAVDPAVLEQAAAAVAPQVQQLREESR